MKLHEIPQESKIKCDVSDGSKFIIFHHIDGMYSYCTTEKGGVAHLGAMQELVKVDDHYELAEEKE